MLSFLKKITTFQTDENHPQEIKKCFAFVEKFLKSRGLKVKTFASNGKLSLISSRKIKKHYQYFLCGHLDVVPAQYPNAFVPTIKGNRLYARGASDMKGPISTLVQLMLDPNLKNVDLALMLTSDEEVGGFNGVKYLLFDKKFSCDCVIVPDGGDNFKLVLAQKGVLHVRFKAFGKSAHGSRPWQGENALLKLINVFSSLQKHFPQITPKNRWQPTCNLGKLCGGEVANKVPNEAEMLLDFRFPQKGFEKKILSFIKETVAKEKGISFSIISQGEPVTMAKTNQYFSKMMKIIKENLKLKLDRCHGASDGRFFAQKGIPIVMFQPQCSPAHVDNEWIDLKSLEKFSHLLKEFLSLPRC